LQVATTGAVCRGLYAEMHRAATSRHAAADANGEAMKLLLRLSLVVAAVVLLAPSAYPVGTGGTFRVRVVRILDDHYTAEPLADVRVTVENGPAKTTAFDGSVLFWLGRSQLNRNVRFVIERGDAQMVVLLPVEPGGIALVAVR
jgi:hypothetical protein